MKWTYAQVGDWLELLDYHQYVATFVEHEIDGEALQALSRDDLKELIPVMGARAKITKARDALFGNT